MRAPEIKLNGDGKGDEVTDRRRGMRLVTAEPSPPRQGFTIAVCEKMFSTSDGSNRGMSTVSNAEQLEAVVVESSGLSTPVDDIGMNENSQRGRIAIAVAAALVAAGLVG